MADRLIRVTTALAVITVATVAAVISYQHAYELVVTHGESGVRRHSFWPLSSVSASPLLRI